jgi:hypothetical protein
MFLNSFPVGVASKFTKKAMDLIFFGLKKINMPFDT